MLAAGRLADEVDAIDILVPAALRNNRGWNSIVLAVDHERVEMLTRALTRLGDTDTPDHARLELLELLAVGANDVALGTVLFSDPAAPGRVRAELDTELAAHGFADADNAVGAAQAPDLPTLHPESRVSVEKYLHKGLNVAG